MRPQNDVSRTGDCSGDVLTSQHGVKDAAPANEYHPSKLKQQRDRPESTVNPSG